MNPAKPLLFVTVLLFGTNAPAFLFPTNPPANVTLAWDASPSAGVDGYKIYYGVGSRQYTNAVPVGLVTIATIANLVRGQVYYFAATCTAGALESVFSSEVSWTAPLPPLPPGGLTASNAVIRVAVQSAPTVNGPWTPYATLATMTDSPAFYRSVVSISAPLIQAAALRVIKSPKASSL